MHAGRIHQNYLSVRSRDYALYSEACRLRFVGNGSYLLADQAIQQRRLSSVGPSYESNVATVKSLVLPGLHQLFRLFGKYLDQVNQRFG